eukprot:7128809-Pyramimonas_sp.AAC.1
MRDRLMASPSSSMPTSLKYAWSLSTANSTSLDPAMARRKLRRPAGRLGNPDCGEPQNGRRSHNRAHMVHECRLCHMAANNRRDLCHKTG